MNKRMHIGKKNLNNLIQIYVSLNQSIRVSKTSISLRCIAVFLVKNDRLDATDFFVSH